MKNNKPVAPGLTVYVINDNINVALSKFKKKVQLSGKLQELRERESYEKPTSKRKKAAASAKKRWERKLESESMPKKMY